jgi:monoamine oxidase
VYKRQGFNAADARTASAVAIGRMTRASAAQAGDEVSRVLRGYDRLVDHLRARLEPLAVRIVLGAKVEQITWRRGHVTVAAGAPLHARAAVITVPLPLLKELSFNPPLADKVPRWRALQMGQVVKVLLQLRDDVPWRGLDFAFVHGPQLLVPTFWRLKPFEGETLVGWAGGPKGDALAGQPDHVAVDAALGSLAALFGVERGAIERKVRSVQVSNWSKDPFTRGAYCVVPSGAARAQDELSTPVDDTLFFAGEATESSFAGTVHGAIISGERAGQWVDQVLRDDWDPPLKVAL